MPKSLRSFCSLLLFCCLALAGLQPARASHIMGGQLTYLNVGPNQYVATLYLYRDCSGATLPASMTLNIRNGCNGAMQGTYPMNPVPNSITVGTQYCPAQQPQAQCTSNAALPNYETQQYRTGTITIQPGQWLLSTEICCRPRTANLVGEANFRYEAVLNNRITVNGVNYDIQNSSAQYSAQDIPVPFVPVNQSTTIGFSTSDPNNTSIVPDTDSLVYSLVAPLEGCAVPVSYKAYPSALPQLHPTIPNCYIFPPANTPQSYTANLPIAVGFNTTGTCPVLQGTTNQFQFTPNAGQFTFTPNRYVTSAPNLGENKYVVVGRVDEYRRIVGNRRALVGSVRREIVVIVINNTNSVPSSPTATPVTPNSGTTVASTGDSLEVTIRPCNYSQVMLRFTDPDPTDLLTVTYTGAGTIDDDMLGSGDIGTYTLVGNGTARPIARFIFQPSPSYAGRVLRIPFRIQDNACPIRGLQTRVLVVRIAAPRTDLAAIAVSSTQPGAGSAVTGLATVCRGSALTLRGFVNRPDSIMSGLQTYSYAWTGPGIVGSANTASISVAPTVTTRYRLSVTPTRGFQTGLCGDTASVLVQVVGQPPTPSISRSGNVLTSSAASGNQWLRNGTAISGATASSYTPTVSGSYSVVVRAGTGAVQCPSAASAPVAVTSSRQPLAGSSLRVMPNPTPDGRVTVLLTGYAKATTLQVFDVLGRPVHTARIAAPNAQGTAHALDLSSLAAGVYVLRVSTAGGVDVCRIVRE